MPSSCLQGRLPAIPVNAPNVDPLIGKTLGQVKLTARIGSGAMGVVYRGWHQRLDREVAVKLLISNRQDKPTYRERFLREGRAAAKVRHDHVVAVLDAGQEGNTAYLVMEYVNGLSLGDILDEAKMLAPDVVTQLGAGIALGLSAIHEKGIVHRDIKPDNILVGSDKKPRVADLGLAKQIDDPEINRLTATGVVVGTPLYVSPEGIRDPATISDRSDIYSLGATFYHMLTGRPPFEGATPYEVMHGHLQGKLTPIRQLRPNVSDSLCHMVERCLSKDPNRRPSALELADFLMQGAKKEPGLSLGTLTFAALIVLGLAGIGVWFMLGKGVLTEQHTVNGQVIKAHQGIIQVTSAVSPLDILIDGTAAPAGELSLAVDPGEHRIVAEHQGWGPLFRAAGSVTVSAGQTINWTPDLQRVSISQVRAPVPGTGMLFVNGVCFGLDQSFPTELAGRFAISRWDGSTWTNGVVVIRDTGAAATPTWAETSAPLPEAYWRTVDDQGNAVSPHHVVSWWEAETIRSRTGLPAPVGWTAQGARPEEAAAGVPPTIAQAYDDLAEAWAAELPTRAQALTLATRLGSSTWCQDGGALARVGGLGGAPLLVVVPRASAP